MSIEFIPELFASGATRDEVLKAYPQLTTEAVEEALKCAAQAVKNEVLSTFITLGEELVHLAMQVRSG